MNHVAFFISTESNVFSFTHHLTGRCVSLAIGTDRNLPSPAELRAQMNCAIELIRAEMWFFAQRSALVYKRLWQESLPPHGHTLVEFSPNVPVHVMFRCVATVCQRLVTAPAKMHVTYSKTWRWAECVMGRVTRCRLGRVQVRLQRRCCLVASAGCANARECNV